MFQIRLLVTTLWLMIQTSSGPPSLPAAQEPEQKQSAEKPEASPAKTVQDYNRLLQQLERATDGQASPALQKEYRIGSGDLLEVSVFEAPDLGRAVRVSESGDISFPLLGNVRAAGSTPHEEEMVLEELLRRTYMKDPHVSVFVKEMQSHPVSVFGAVKRPGVFQIRGAKTLVEILSMAEGLANDAGDTVLVTHQTPPAGMTWVSGSRTNPSEVPEHAKPNQVPEMKLVAETGTGGAVPESKTEEINLKSLLESQDSQFNVLVYPGDLVKVVRAGVVYVVGEVKEPGGFQLKTNENISVLQAIALAQGLTHTSAKSRARIIHTDEATGTRKETYIDLEKVLSGKVSDPVLQSRDILFIPNSTGRSALYRGMEAVVSVGTGVAISRR